MKYDTDTIEKIYYSMREAADRLGVKGSCIRFWDYRLNINFRLNKRGERFFTQRDLELLNVIKILRFERKFTLAGTQQELKRLGWLK